VSYAVIGDITARLPTRPISASSKPTQAQIEAWILDATYQIDGALAAEGLPAPYTAAGAVSQIKAWICEYVEGLVRQAHASGDGDGSNDDGEKLIEHWFARLDDISRNPSKWGGRLAAGAVSAQSCHVRSTASTDVRDPDFEMGDEL
jgi:hypothetical protein